MLNTTMVSWRFPGDGLKVVMCRHSLSLRLLVQFAIALLFIDAHCHPSAGKVLTVRNTVVDWGVRVWIGGFVNPPVPSPLPSLPTFALNHCRRQSRVIVNVCIGTGLQCLQPPPFLQQQSSSTATNCRCRATMMVGQGM